MIETNTFKGNICKKCGGAERYVRSHECVNCNKEYMRQWRRRNPEKVKQYLKDGRVAIDRAKAQYIVNHPDIYKCRKVVIYAKASKRLIPQPCTICGDPNAEAHHPDYSKPLDVIWLCPIHHREEHRRLKGERKAS